MGPQVGYYVPQILMEEDLHGPGIDARGAAFPGVNLYVQLGHGRDYAWSATTADLRQRRHLRRGPLPGRRSTTCARASACAMEKLDRTNLDAERVRQDAAGLRDADRLPHRARHRLRPRHRRRARRSPSSTQRTTYFHEADSALGFSQLNEPGCRHRAEASSRRSRNINFGFNWAYVDADHIAYQHSGWYPQRAQGHLAGLPDPRHRRVRLEGLRPGDPHSTLPAVDQHPHAIDPDYLVSWNNKQAPGWAAADDNYGFGPLLPLAADRRPASRAAQGRARSARSTQLVQAMEEPATEDIRGALLPIIRKAIGKPKSAQARATRSRCCAPGRHGAHRRDLNGDGGRRRPPRRADGRLVAEAPGRRVQAGAGQQAYDASQAMLAIGDHTGGAPDAPDFDDGWWGYVAKDLRDLFGRKPQGRRCSRVYCGGGSKREVPRGAAGASRAALKVDPGAALRQRMATAPTTRRRAASTRTVRPSPPAIDLPPFPFQNRPTFQQVVTLTRHPAPLTLRTPLLVHPSVSADGPGDLFRG